jgi:hypothetical protein
MTDSKTSAGQYKKASELCQFYRLFGQLEFSAHSNQLQKGRLKLLKVW